MSYNVDEPAERHNLEISREHYRKYRPLSEKHNLFQHFSPFNGPDSDIVLKTTSGLMYGSIIGFNAAMYTVIRHTNGRFTLAGVAERSFKHGTPWLVAGATYGVTLSLITQFRQKESPANHAIAGYAAGTMFGSWYKYPKMGVWGGAITAITAGLLKFWHDNDMLEAMPLRRQRLFNHYRRGWLTEKPDGEGKDDAELDVSYRFYKP